jgi:hypothetical protein
VGQEAIQSSWAAAGEARQKRGKGKIEEEGVDGGEEGAEDEKGGRLKPLILMFGKCAGCVSSSVLLRGDNISAYSIM